MSSEDSTSQIPPTSGFDYCFWSKLLVAIVLFPMVAFIVSSFFASAIIKILAAVCAIGAIVVAAIYIDRIPCLAKKIPAIIK